MIRSESNEALVNWGNLFLRKRFWIADKSKEGIFMIGLIIGVHDTNIQNEL